MVPSNKGEEEIVQLMMDIAHYLKTHPTAADTPTGIARWWLPPPRRDAVPRSVETALEYLVIQGFMKKASNPDGTIVYSASECHPSPHC